MVKNIKIAKKLRVLAVGILLLLTILNACDVKNPPKQTTPTPVSTLKPLLNESYTPEPTPLPPTATLTATFTATLPPTPTPTVKAVIADLIPVFKVQLEAPHFAWGSNLSQNRIFRSEDSGTTWKEVTPPEAAEVRHHGAANAFLGSNNAWLLLSQGEQSSTLFYTTDGAKSWKKSELPFAGGKIQFVHADNTGKASGVIFSDLGAGAGSQWIAIYVSADGGQTWQQTFTHTPGEGQSALPAGGTKSGLSYNGDQRLWVAGSAPIENFLYLYHSADLGKSWSAQTCDMQQVAETVMYDTYPPEWVSGTEAFLRIKVFYGAAEMKTVFCHTSDHGETWNFASILDEINLQQFVDSQHGWVGDENHLMRSIDEARSWEDLSTGLPAGETVVSFNFSTPSLGILITNPSNGNNFDENKLYLSIDGGISWTLLPTKLLP
ncbi:MAG: hypothetical protein GXY37_05320 [Chloroflexi bacterium]|nr:hypothetical protein [Chloroflexota bacterium]